MGDDSIDPLSEDSPSLDYSPPFGSYPPIYGRDYPPVYGGDSPPLNYPPPFGDSPPLDHSPPIASNTPHAVDGGDYPPFPQPPVLLASPLGSATEPSFSTSDPDPNGMDPKLIKCTITMYTGYEFSGDYVTFSTQFDRANAYVASYQNFATSFGQTWKFDDKVVSMKIGCKGKDADSVTPNVSLRMYDWPYYKIIKDRASGAIIHFSDWPVADVANMGGGGRKASSFALIYMSTTYKVTYNTAAVIVEDYSEPTSRRLLL
eukprot:gene4113-14217_t